MVADYFFYLDLIRTFSLALRIPDPIDGVFIVQGICQLVSAIPLPTLPHL